MPQPFSDELARQIIFLLSTKATALSPNSTLGFLLSVYPFPMLSVSPAVWQLQSDCPALAGRRGIVPCVPSTKLQRIVFPGSLQSMLRRILVVVL